MTLEDLDSIDLIARAKDSRANGLDLIIIDAGASKTSERRLETFLMKLRLYVAFVSSEQFRKEHPETRPSDVRICLEYLVPPTPEMLQVTAVRLRGDSGEHIPVSFREIPREAPVQAMPTAGLPRPFEPLARARTLACAACGKPLVPGTNWCSACGAYLSSAEGKEFEAPKLPSRIRVGPSSAQVVLLTVFGSFLYHFLWFYRSWGVLQGWGMRVRPWVRTVGMLIPGLNILWPYLLFRRLGEHVRKADPERDLSAGLLTFFYLLGFGMAYLGASKLRNHFFSGLPLPLSPESLLAMCVAGSLMAGLALGIAQSAMARVVELSGNGETLRTRPDWVESLLLVAGIVSVLLTGFKALA